MSKRSPDSLVRSMPPTNATRIVDDDRLLVMAVERSFVVVERAADPGAFRERPLHLPDVVPRRPEQRQRCACPGEHPDVGALGHLGQQVPEHDRRVALPLERESGGEEQAGEMDVGGRTANCVRHDRQRLGAVDQDVDRVPAARRRASACPGSRGRVERSLPAEALEPALVMATDLPRDRVAESGLEGHESISRCTGRVPTGHGVRSVGSAHR